MEIIPAIDIMDGQVVRLRQGDFDAVTHYDAAPVDVATAFEAAGARSLHVVNLDGARGTGGAMAACVRDIAAATGLAIQTGGGVRSRGDVEALAEAGASRVVIGSLAARDILGVRKIIETVGGEAITLAFDVRAENGTTRIAISGWAETTELTLFEALRSYGDMAGVCALVTDVGRDGMLEGPNVDLYTDICSAFPQISIQASGGVSSLDDLRRLRKTGAAGAIVGKALYEKRFTLKEAIDAG